MVNRGRATSAPSPLDAIGMRRSDIARRGPRRINCEFNLLVIRVKSNLNCFRIPLLAGAERKDSSGAFRNRFTLFSWPLRADFSVQRDSANCVFERCARAFAARAPE